MQGEKSERFVKRTDGNLSKPVLVLYMFQNIGGKA